MEQSEHSVIAAIRRLDKTLDHAAASVQGVEKSFLRMRAEEIQTQLSHNRAQIREQNENYEAIKTLMAERHAEEFRALETRHTKRIEFIFQETGELLEVLKGLGEVDGEIK